MSNLSDLDHELEPKPGKKPKSIAFQAWGHFWGDLMGDVVHSLLGFIPNGLNVTYDCLFKKLPLLGVFFRHTWVEETLKFLTGITIGRGISKDIGRYVFWPLGFFLGLVFAPFLPRNAPKPYRQQVSHVLYQLSGQTISGALIGGGALWVGVVTSTSLQFASLDWRIWGVALCVGALVGLLAKSIMLLAVDAVTRAQAASSRLNAKRAKKLGDVLKEKIKERSHQKVYRYARGIIEQMHGPQIESHVQSFFAMNHSQVCETTFKKIDRHLDYLSDRGVHGDMNALKKLMKLYRDFQQHNGALDELIDRILNAREKHNLQNHVDNLYDQWNYQSLRKA